MATRNELNTHAAIQSMAASMKRIADEVDLIGSTTLFGEINDQLQKIRLATSRQADATERIAKVLEDWWKVSRS